MRMPSLWFAGTSGLLIGLLIGCNDGGSSDCQLGTYFCQCFNGTCQVGLVCTQNYCLNPGEELSTTG